MSSEEIKESLDEWLGEILEDDTQQDELEKYLGKWKRVSKKRDKEGRENRIFTHTLLNKKVLVVDDDIQGWLAEGRYAFYIYEREKDDYVSASCFVSITDLDYFKSDNCASDWHLSGLVALPEYLDELSEADFASQKSIKSTRSDLLAYGLVEDPEFNKFMDCHR